MLPVKIAGMGWYLPEKLVTNADLETQIGIPADWIERVTGVQERRYATTETTLSMGAIEGRCDDICYFESLAGGKRPFFPDTIRRMILLASPEIADYQVVQEQVGQLNIHLALAPEASFDRVVQAVRESVAATVEGYDCRMGAISIEEGLEELAAGVKRRRVRSISR